MELILTCDTHGTEDWRGDICCLNCDRVYQTENEKAAHYAPEFCECGERLMPVKENLDIPFQASPICHHCYIKARMKQDGQLN